MLAGTGPTWNSAIKSLGHHDTQLALGLFVMTLTFDLNDDLCSSPLEGLGTVINEDNLGPDTDRICP